MKRRINIGIITTEECRQAISTIEELKVNLAETKDIISKPYKLVYYALCTLQEGINTKIIEKGISDEQRDNTLNNE